MTSRFSKTADYRADIDGLRAIAVTSVVIYHAHIGLCRSGFVGVDIFFAISGYLIAGIIFREVTAGTFSFAGFYARRVRRILPALLMVVAAVTFFALLVLSPREMSKCAVSAAATLAGVSNVYFYHDTQYFSASALQKPLLMTWSLGVEEQFYVLFPILLVTLRSASRRSVIAVLLVLSALSLAGCIFTTPFATTAAFYLPLCRIWELAGGALLAIVQVSETAPGWSKGAAGECLSLAGTALLLMGIFGLDPTAPYPGWHSLLPVCGTLALIASRGSLINRKLLAAPPLVAIGLISYSWYLWHWPLFSFAYIIAAGPPSRLVMLFLLVLSLAFAALSWRFVERPFRRPSLPRNAILRRYAAAAAATAVVLACIVADHGAPRRFTPQVGSADAQAEAGQNSACIAGYGDATLNRSPACVTPAGGMIALIGDSHANSWAPMVRQLAARHGFGFEQFTKSSCPSLDRVVRLFPEHPANAAECFRYNAQALPLVESDPRVKLVIMAGYWSAPAAQPGDRYIKLESQNLAAPSATALQDGLTATLAGLHAAGKRVIVLGDVPSFSFDPVQRALSQLIPARRTLHDLVAGDDGLGAGVAAFDDVTSPNGQLDDLVRHTAGVSPGVSYIDPLPEFCSASGCAFMTRAGLLAYSDPQHLTPAGSLQLIDVLDQAAFSAHQKELMSSVK